MTSEQLDTIFWTPAWYHACINAWGLTCCKDFSDWIKLADRHSTQATLWCPLWQCRVLIPEQWVWILTVLANECLSCVLAWVYFPASSSHANSSCTVCLVSQEPSEMWPSFLLVRVGQSIHWAACDKCSCNFCIEPVPGNLFFILAAYSAMRQWSAGVMIISR